MATHRDNGLCGDDLSRRALRRYLWRVVTPRAIASYVLYLLRHRDPVYAALPRLGGTLGGLDEIYRSLPLRRDQADIALVGVGA